MSLFDPYRDPVQVPQFRSKFGGFWTDLNNSVELVQGKLELGLINEEEAQLLLSFIENGYVILRGAVDEALIEQLNDDVDKLVENPPPEAWVNCIEDGHAVTRQMSPQDKDAVNKMLKLLDLYSFLPSAQALIFAPQIVRFIKLVFERPLLAHQSLHFFKGSQQPIHRDTTFVRISSPMELLASWIALEDLKPGSGELVYYPKSHLFPEFFFEGKYRWCPPGSPELGQCYDYIHECAQAQQVTTTKFLANKGDVLIWSADFAHGGGEIDDPSKTRRSMAAHYSPLGTYPMYRHYEGSSDIVKCGDGTYYCSARKVYWTN